MNRYINKESNRAFTIIELLIVIVIIAILVAITAVGYNGLTRGDKETVVQSDLKQAKTSLELNKAKNGTYPPNLESNIPPIDQPKNSTFTYTQLDGGNNYTLVATSNSNPDIAFKTTPSTGITSIVPFVAGGHIQTATKDTCPSSRTLAVDARDNHTYYIQKLADNQCWMLTNLAYAGGGNNTYNDVINQGDGTPGTNTINGPDNAGSTTYTLAKYYIPTGANPTTDPTPPSTDTTGGGSGAGRQYGYLYNWCAAMGGQNTAACANATTPAPVPTTNICPAGWRLPTVSPTNEFTALNTAINAGSTSSDAGLLSNGLFQRSGYWYNGFYSQGLDGLYWSSTQNSATYAHDLYFYSTYVDPAGNYGKIYARAVRCIAE